jgi:metabotropic glutamate receptor 2/3/metabotropic glutamate receptor 6/7/8
MWGNSPLNGSTECIDIQESYLMPQDPWAIVLMILAIIGLLSVVFVSSVFIWFIKTNTIKSMDCNHTIPLLIEITLSFLVTVVYIIRPSPAVCGIQTIIMWLFLPLMACTILPLLIETIVFSDKFKANKINKYLSNKFPITNKMNKRCWCNYKIIYTFLLISGLMIIVLFSLIFVHPNVVEIVLENELQVPYPPILKVECSSSHLAPLIIQILYYTVLVTIANILAIAVMFISNQKQLRLTASSSFVLSLLWVIFIPLHFIVDPNDKVIIISLTIQLNALCVLGFAYLPTVVKLIVMKRKNAAPIEIPKQD